MKLGLSLLAALVVAAAALGWFLTAPRPISAEIARAVSGPGDPEAGRIVFHLGGCASCHAASDADAKAMRLGGGAALKTPFGSFYPPNISPDPVDGIGKWTGVEFANAVLAGVGPRDEHLYPAFPYPSYRNMAIKDVRDLHAFLMTLPRVSGKPPPNALAFPFSIRRAVGVWKLLYMPWRVDPPDEAPKAIEARGRYIVEGPGHCGECHTPRSFLGGMIQSRALTGAVIDGKRAPNITARGLKSWSEQDIAEAISTGFTPDGDILGGAMGEVIANLSQAPAKDLAAIAHYLKSFTPTP